MSKCLCNQSVQSLGIFECNIFPGIIKRMVFTTSKEPINISGTGPVGTWGLALAWSSTPWELEDGLVSPPPSTVDFLYYYPSTYKLFTETIDDFVSEREDDVREEVGGTQFFVRRGNRTVTATFVMKNVELVKFLEDLRCHRLGVFLIDNNEIVWGLRGNSNVLVKPIWIKNATISSRLQFPSASTVEKITLSFTFEDFSDGDLVPIIDNQTHINLTGVDLMSYLSPARITGTYQVNAGNIVFTLSVPIATSAGVISIPVTGYAGNLQLYNGTTLLPNTFTEIQPGYYQTTAPTNWTHLVFDMTVFYTENYDFYSFRINK
ncbi:MAG: hypothetical protein NZZ41_06870 [Candidatus Dojkabacteria bacterium]|nr:hypothetical protein [Candidatus Dojkabacteria bacterium]